MTSAPYDHLLQGKNLLNWHAALDRYTNAVEVDRQSACYTLEAGSAGTEEIRKTTLDVHDSLGSLAIDLYRLLEVVERQLAEPTRPVDRFLEALYHRFGETWAIGTPEPPPPPPYCPHPEALPKPLVRATLVAYRSGVLRTLRSAQENDWARVGLRAHPTTQLFPEFVEIIGGSTWGGDRLRVLAAALVAMNRLLIHGPSRR